MRRRGIPTADGADGTDGEAKLIKEGSGEPVESVDFVSGLGPPT